MQGKQNQLGFLHKEPSFTVKRFGNDDYTFRRLSVAAESEIIFHAMEADDAEYDNTYNDGVVAYTLYGEVSKQLLEDVKDIDIALYYLAFYYQHFLPHGVDLRTRGMSNLWEILHSITPY